MFLFLGGLPYFIIHQKPIVYISTSTLIVFSFSEYILISIFYFYIL